MPSEGSYRRSLVDIQARSRSSVPCGLLHGTGEHIHTELNADERAGLERLPYTSSSPGRSGIGRNLASSASSLVATTRVPETGRNEAKAEWHKAMQPRWHEILDPGKFRQVIGPSLKQGA